MTKEKSIRRVDIRKIVLEANSGNQQLRLAAIRKAAEIYAGQDRPMNIDETADLIRIARNAIHADSKSERMAGLEILKRPFAFMHLGIDMANRINNNQIEYNEAVLVLDYIVKEYNEKKEDCGELEIARIKIREDIVLEIYEKAVAKDDIEIMNKAGDILAAYPSLEIRNTIIGLIDSLINRVYNKITELEYAERSLDGLDNRIMSIDSREKERKRIKKEILEKATTAVPASREETINSVMELLLKLPTKSEKEKEMIKGFVNEKKENIEYAKQTFLAIASA